MSCCVGNDENECFVGFSGGDNWIACNLHRIHQPSCALSVSAAVALKSHNFVAHSPILAMAKISVDAAFGGPTITVELLHEQQQADDAVVASWRSELLNSAVRVSLSLHILAHNFQLCSQLLICSTQLQLNSARSCPLLLSSFHPDKMLPATCHQRE